MADRTITHIEVAELLESGGQEQAAMEVMRLLNENPDDARALFLAGTLNIQAGRFGLAVALMHRCIALAPRRAEAHNNLGMALESMGRYEAALASFERALALSPGRPNFLANAGLAKLHLGDPSKAIKLCDQALAGDPDMRAAKITRGFACLQVGDWSAGWGGYRAALGGKFRMRIDYGLPEWEGEADAHVIVYGEQGLGDEILYASCLPDIIARVRRVTVDCDSRLAGVLARSYPTIEVHGTRRTPGKPWLTGQETAQVAIGDLPWFFRPTPESCPRTPYLVADPRRVAMYRSLFNVVLLRAPGAPRRPRIGIAWSAGTQATAGFRRRFDSALFGPLAAQADLVSLQYDPPGRDDLGFAWPPATGRGVDYDETLAFIDALDGVIAVDTTAAHAAGSLGKPTMVLVHDKANWICGPYQGDRSAWYANTQLFRQAKDEQWPATLGRLFSSPRLKAFLDTL